MILLGFARRQNIPAIIIWTKNHHLPRATIITPSTEQWPSTMKSPRQLWAWYAAVGAPSQRPRLGAFEFWIYDQDAQWPWHVFITISRTINFNPRRHSMGGGWCTPPLRFFEYSHIVQKHEGRARWNLAKLCVHSFYTYSENFRFGSGQVTELWHHAWRHVRSKSSDFAIYCIWVSSTVFWIVFTLKAS